MKDTTMLSAIRTMLGVPTCAIPLSFCKPAKTYLLDRAGIPPEGTAIIFAVPYLVTEDVADSHRNLSLYAVPRDYHGYMAELGETFLPRLRETYPHNRFALFADHSPICEVDAAARAGLGVLGDNGLLITEEYGSFVFLGEIVTDADFSAVTGGDVPTVPAEPPSCENCGACAAACPGGCIGGDRSRCLSAITQKKGALTEDDMEAIRRGGLAWGCDVCQLVCPHNLDVIRGMRDTVVPYFRRERVTQLDLDGLDEMSDEAFRRRAFAWRGRDVIRRNLSILEHKE